jgi:ribosome-binding protein aMBF1 (putative translation factor)
MAETTDALKIGDRTIGDDPTLRVMIEKEDIRARIGRLAFDARVQSGSTQDDLAERLGVCRSVLDRLENAEYRSDALVLLQRIAAVLNQEIEIRLVPVPDTSLSGT